MAEVAGEELANLQAAHPGCSRPSWSVSSLTSAWTRPPPDSPPPAVVPPGRRAQHRRPRSRPPAARSTAGRGRGPLPRASPRAVVAPRRSAQHRRPQYRPPPHATPPDLSPPTPDHDTPSPDLGAPPPEPLVGLGSTDRVLRRRGRERKQMVQTILKCGDGEGTFLFCITAVHIYVQSTRFDVNLFYSYIVQISR